MRVEQEVIEGKTIPFTLDELWQFRKELKEVLGNKLNTKLAEFAEEFHSNPNCILEEYRDAAYKIFWLMKLIPAEPNPN